jgi:hypothetical protein
MENLVVFGVPLLLGALILLFFWRDMPRFRQPEILNVEELQALVQRHRLALILHFALFAPLLAFMIFGINQNGFLGAILLALVFVGHLSALRHFSRPLILRLQFLNETRARGKQMVEQED